MAALLENAGVVEDAGHHRLTLGEDRQRMGGRLPRHIHVSPARIAQEMRQPLMFGIDASRIRAGTRRDRLHGLAFTVAEQADRVRGEGSRRCSSPSSFPIRSR
jgi:hypothetical protein